MQYSAYYVLNILVIALSVGIVFAAIMMALLLGSLLLLGVIIYRRMGPASDEKSAEVDNGAFEGYVCVYDVPVSLIN